MRKEIEVILMNLTFNRFQKHTIIFKDFVLAYYLYIYIK